MSKSIVERAREFWVGCKKNQEDNHMVRHQALVHSRVLAMFTLRVVGSHPYALSRQISEAVKIRRRGGLGNILNTKYEYNRCHIVRIRKEDE